ncbi:MFS transporter [Enhygromyxa salina]|uniref:Major Facilitator Superfamily protein n=1 Tax=Enhygromyxa salina TaxID=215803 RepID=A0A2S9YPC2_9BACT|nr:MFS transporter [Enhygromyxa salina]PRQ06937.1 Major Facilitator Superfamily protein [Enhygromyxa salina]
MTDTPQSGRQPSSGMRRIFDPDHPISPRRLPFFYGYVVVVGAILGVLASVPGQSTGFAVFTDHLIAASGLTRLQLSNTYMLGTVGCALLLPYGGKLLDRWGARPTAMLACMCLGATLVLLTATAPIFEWSVDWFADSPAAQLMFMFSLLSIAFVSLKLATQGMLTMVSRTMIAKWFARRRGLVVALAGAIVGFGFAIAPIGFSALIQAIGWRETWWALALAVGVGMTLVAWVLYRDNPESCGLLMDGDQPLTEPQQVETRIAPPPEDVTRGQAIRTLPFWTVTLALSLHTLMTTGLAFHIVDLGAVAGYAEAEVVKLFLPMAVITMVIVWLSGLAADRFDMRWLLAGMMVAEGVGMLGAANLGTATAQWAMIGGIGFAGGVSVILSTVALPHYFGRAHLGAISGAQMMCMVLSGALGPSMLAWSRSATGGYAFALESALVPVIVVIVLSLFTRPVRSA